MIELKMGEVESRFADMIWDHAPVNSGTLAQMAEKALGWKKSTTYTILKRFCQKGIFANDKGTVTTLISREEFFARQSERVVEESFGGSLPAFVAAFTKHQSISESDLDEMQRMIDRIRRGES